MPGEVKIKIEYQIDTGLLEKVLGGAWYWSVTKQLGLYAGRIYGGFAYTEKGARRKAEKVARRVVGNEEISYTYNPEGLL